MKTFIFDIDDLIQVKDGKRVWNLMEDQLNMIPPNKNWMIEDGELIPSPFEIPGNQNPNKLTTAELMGQDKLEVPDSMREFNTDKFLDGSNMNILSDKVRKMNTKKLINGYLNILVKQ